MRTQRAPPSPVPRFRGPAARILVLLAALAGPVATARAADDAWLAVDDRLAAGDVAGAHEAAEAYEGPDAHALRRYVASPPEESAKARRALRAAEARREAEDPSGAAFVVEALQEETRGLVAVRLAQLHAQALRALERYREADAAYGRAAHEARRVGWLGAESRALAGRFKCREALHDAAGMLEAAERRLEVLTRLDLEIARAVVHANIGNLRAMLHDYPRALRHLRAAITVFRRVGRRDFEGHVLASTALIHLRRAEYVRSLEDLDAAQALWEEVGEAEQAAYVLTLRAEVHLRLGDLERAHDLLETALDLRGDAPTQGRGEALGDLGLVCRARGDLDEALEHLSEAHDVFATIRNPPAVANTLIEIGEILCLSGRRALARDRFEQALALESDEPRIAAAALVALARTHQSEGEWPRAEEYVRQAMAKALVLEDRDLHANLYAALAEIQHGNGEPYEAMESVDRAMALLGQVLEPLADEQVLRARHCRATLFETGVLAALATGKPRLVAKYLEHARAGVLLQALGGRAALQGAGMPPELEEAEARAKESLAAATIRYSAARQEGGLALRRAARADLEEARRQFAGVMDRIQRESKRAAAFTYPNPASLDDVRASLWEGEVFVLYGLVAGRAVAVVTSTEGSRLVELGPSGDIERACEELVAQVREEEGPAIEARLEALADLVVRPLGLPETTDRVLVSPDGPLSYVPFPVLVPGVEVACVPSGTTYRFLAAERDRTGSGILAMGDPVYVGHEGSPGAQVYARGTRLDPLPATRQEVEQITGEGDVRLLGERATEAGFQTEVLKHGRWRAVHFACHGLVDPSPTLSALALTPEALDDGFLTALEVFRLPVPADLVVLSACETGRGRNLRGEGLVGLAGAFMRAGSPRVIVSLWKVNDEATQALMVEFYRLWRAGRSTAEALREAQVHVSAQPGWEHPRYWGAWVLWGPAD